MAIIARLHPSDLPLPPGFFVFPRVSSLLWCFHQKFVVYLGERVNQHCGRNMAGVFLLHFKPLWL